VAAWRPTIAQRAWCGFAVIVLLMTGTAAGLRRQLATAAEARAAAAATAERIEHLDLLLIRMLDVEVGQRGYVITGNPAFLEPYRASASRVDDMLRLIERDARTDPTPHLPSLKRYVDAKLVYAQRTIELRERDGLVAAAAEIGRSEGKRLMDGVRAEIARMIRHERARLATRTTAAEVQERQTRRVVYAALSGALVLMLAIGLMLTVQLRRRAWAERETRRSARLLQTTLDNVGVGVAVAARDGRIVERNAELIRMLPEAESDDAPPELAEELKLVRDGRPFLLERPVGKASAALVRGVALPNGRFLVAVLDVSEARRAEQVKSEFVSTVSHELRTPVTSIRGSLGMLAGPLAAGLSDKQQSLVELALRNAERLTVLVNDILDIEKIEAGRMEFAFEACDVNRLLRDAAETNRAYADARDVTLALGTLPRPVLVWADPHRVQQVMANLISNAAKFSEPGGVVTVTVEPDGECARISVNDNGPGIPEAFRSRIFERFAQADARDARAKSGTGLGLSIAKAIVERLGGALSFASRPGDTSFSFTIPLCSADAGAPDPASATPAVQGTPCR
jgi:signal transduction histidine kinase